MMSGVPSIESSVRPMHSHHIFLVLELKRMKMEYFLAKKNHHKNHFCK